MSWGTIDTKEFDAFAKRVGAEANPSKLKSELRQSMLRVGSQALRGVKNRTPAKTGTLRRGWEIKGPVIGVDIVLTMMNNVEYAQYVESGHRTRGGGGWVPGSHMLMTTLFEIDNQMSALLTPAFQSYLQKVM